MNTLALVLACLAAICSGAAAVLQAIPARKIHTEGATLTALLRQPLYLLALVFIVAGFVLAFLALRDLPLFVVQAIRACSLVVTALIVVALGTRLRAREATGLLVATAGLVLLGLSAQPSASWDAPSAIRYWLPVIVVALALAGIIAVRTMGDGAALLLAFLAGLGFAGLALGARLISGGSLADLLSDPAAYAAGMGGLVGLGLGALAYGRAPVVRVTATIVATETIVSSLAGILLAGDRPMPGREALAIAGFVLALTGALVLARFGNVDDVEFGRR